MSGIDFVCIGEFSELVGPVPRHIVPKESASGLVDPNSLILKVMTCDYQQTNGSAASSYHGSSPASESLGSLAEDSQVVLPMPEENGWVYVQHLNLLDVVARGYVRPMCLCYVTHDPRKLNTCFSSMRKAFTQISDILKRGNQRRFRADLDLLVAQLNEQRKEFVQVEEEEEEEEEEVAVLAKEEEKVDVDKENEHENADDAFTLSVGRGATALESFDEFIDDLKAMREALALRMQNANMAPHVDMIVRQMEAIERDALSATLATGRSSRSIKWLSLPTVAPDEGDSYDYLAANALPDFSHILHNIMDIEGASQRREGTKTLRALPQLCGAEFKAAALRLNQLHRHFSRPSIVLAFEREEAQCLAPMSSLLSVGRAPLMNFHWNSELIFRQSSSDEDDDDEEDGEEEDEDDGQEEDEKDEDEEGNLMSLAKFKSRARRKRRKRRERRLSEQRAERERRLQSADPLSPLVDPSYPDVRLESFTSSLWSTSRYNTGSGLLKLCVQLPFMKHIVYSMLKGRPVVVVGSSKRKVRRLVRACSLFVPGNRTRSIEWRATPLRMPDLARIRLIGLSRQGNALPKAVRRYATVLDFDQSILCAPTYTGTMLSEMTSARKMWPSEEVFLSFVHHELHQIALKACLYYHLCCVGVSDSPSSPSATANSAALARSRSLRRAAEARSSTSSSSSLVAPRSPASDVLAGSDPVSSVASQSVPSLSKASMSSPKRSRRSRSRRSGAGESASSTLSPSSPSSSSKSKGRSGTAAALDLAAELPFVSRHRDTTSSLARRRRAGVPTAPNASSSAQPTPPPSPMHTSHESKPVPNSVQPLDRDIVKHLFFARFDIEKCDQHIIEHLAEIVKLQQFADIASSTPPCTLFLDSSPSQFHTAVPPSPQRRK
jgi:hypothetical protein